MSWRRDASRRGGEREGHTSRTHAYLYDNFYLRWHKLMDIIGARRGLCGTLFAITDGKLAESASKKQRERERERRRIWHSRSSEEEAFNGRARVRPYCICVVR